MTVKGHQIVRVECVVVTFLFLSLELVKLSFKIELVIAEVDESEEVDDAGRW